MNPLGLNSMPIFEFSIPTIEDLCTLGISEALYSPYNVKAVFEGKIVGYIIIEDRPVNVPMRKKYSKGVKDYVEMINKQKWFLIRKIAFMNQYKETGNLYNMFDYLIKQLPNDCYLWTNVYWDRKTQFIDYIGGFTALSKEICKNENIRVFSVYQIRNE